MPARSIINTLPKEIRDALHQRLTENGFSDYAGLTEWMQGQGFKISRSAIHRYGQNLEKMITAMPSREMEVALLPLLRKLHADLHNETAIGSEVKQKAEKAYSVKAKRANSVQKDSWVVTCLEPLSHIFPPPQIPSHDDLVDFSSLSLADAYLRGDFKSKITPESATSWNDLCNPRVQKIISILHMVEHMPAKWTEGKHHWIEYVAKEHNMTGATIYRWIKKYNSGGTASLRHTKSNVGIPNSWTPEAIDWWLGLCLKREHLDIKKKDLYENCLVIEAQRRGWKIGSLASARWWFKKRVTPAMLALQKVTRW